MRRKHLYIGLATLAFLLLAHWIFWYRPRERAGAPSARSVPGATFLASDLTYRMWLPYPHQNLAALEEALGDTEELFVALSRVSGQDLPAMPSFGAADVPPASELVLAADEEGDRFVAVARVYPIPAMLARWAGRLAGNPLLAGGSAEIDGRAVEASWEGSTWTIVSHGLRPESPGETADAGEVALAWLGLSEARGPVAAGHYRLYRDGRDLALTGGEPEAVESLLALGREAAPMPLVAAQSFRTTPRVQARLLGLIPGVESLGGLPGAVTAWRGKKRWKPPGERVLSVLGDGPPTRKVSGWKVMALDRASLAAGEELVALGSGFQGASPLDLALWIELRAAGQLVDQVVEALEAVPVIGQREARRWRAASSVLHRFDGYARLTAFATADPPALVARLERTLGASPQAGGAAPQASEN